jgi:ABC-2 type transport system ATP-binding protein
VPIAPRINAPLSAPVIEARGISRHFRRKVALNVVSLVAREGEVHAVLGPNGAGKTTLLRILAGLLEPTEGVVRVLGMDPAKSPRRLRQVIGVVPSGDRTFYLRISGLQNLVFFARLHGIRRREAVARSRRVLAEVGLLDAADRRVGIYSHGMQKRLSVARALLTEPSVLIVDEATHDLDPAGARDARELVRAAARRGVTVIWATQRLDEIRGFADRVALLTSGQLRFAGTVPELMSEAPPQRYMLRLLNGQKSGQALQPILERALTGIATIAWSTGSRHDYVLALSADVPLGDALRSLLASNVQVLACRQERSDIEEAFLSLTQEPPS